MCVFVQATVLMYLLVALYQSKRVFPLAEEVVDRCLYLEAPVLWTQYLVGRY